jgi:ABC-type multidrug transport system fused ATPase/permease subunit
LHGLDFQIKPGEKVGILGRTGSGKSTLALSFFRFVEATEGTIEIDDINIARIGLTDLRGKLTIIPRSSLCYKSSFYSDDSYCRGSHYLEWNSAVYIGRLR